MDRHRLRSSWAGGRARLDDLGSYLAPGQRTRGGARGDPGRLRSLFRGDYVILGYDISRFDLPAGTQPPKRNAPFYITLKKSDGANWRAVSGSAERPSDVKPDETVIKGRVEYISSPPTDRPQDVSGVGLHYGIESFFVPEGTGRELEKLVGDKKISAVIAVDEEGNAAIKGLMSEGRRIYEEPLL